MIEKFNSPHYNSYLAEISSTFQCPACGGNSLELGAGVPPHSASLRCGECGGFVRWLENPKNLEQREAENDLIDELLRHPHLLNGWERMFLRSVRDTKKRSPRQREKLGAIAEKIAEKGNMRSCRSPPCGE